MTPRKIIKLAEKHGWRLDRITGGHILLVKDGKRTVPVQSHLKEYDGKKLKSILKQLDIKKVR